MKLNVLPADQLTPEHIASWARLHADNPTLASAYFHPAFTQAVAAVRRDVEVGVMEEAGTIVGFFPFQRGRLGIAKPVGGIVSDFQGVIAEPDLVFDPRELLLGCCLNAWDFDHMLVSQAPFTPFHAHHYGSPLINVTNGFEAYKEERRKAGSKHIQKLGTLWRKIEREIGPLRFEAHTTSADALDTTLRWKSAQYRSTGVLDLFRLHPWAGELLARLQQTQEDSFAGMISTLHAGDQLIATHAGMRSRTAWHYWFPAYDEKFHPYSPGLLLLLHIIEHAPKLGLKRIDLGKGDSFYKERFMNGSLPLADGRVERPSWVTMCRGSWRGLSRWARGSPPAQLLRRWKHRKDKPASTPEET
ncbi:MAG: GNAT family N-acetyltransferase [Planctomycetes bacterium]|nr:GNAT family N-acetyltransferase [Planctomycetota bacterium]